MRHGNLDYIERMRIHELRDYARKMGIQSPTTLKKEELLQKIHEIIRANDIVNNDNDDTTPYESFDFFSLLTSADSAFLDKLIKQKIKTNKKVIEHNNNPELSNTLVMKKSSIKNANTPYAYHSNDYFRFNFCIAQNEAEYNLDEDQDVEGYVDIHPNGYGILRADGFVPNNEDDVYLTLAMVKQYSLRKGDYVCGKVRVFLENKPRIMYEVVSIDGNPKDDSPMFDDIAYKQNCTTFYLDRFDFDIKKGERLYCNHMSIETAIKLGYDIVDENGVNVKFINFNARPEEFYESHQKMTVINCPFNKSESDLVSTVELVVERIKREFEDSKSNVLMIYNFSEMIKVFNVESEGYYVFDKFNLKGLNRVKNILYTSKFFDEKTHVTVICIDRDEVPEDIKQVFNSELMNLFNKLFYSKENTIEKKENE